MARSKEPQIRANIDLLGMFDDINVEYFGGIVCGGISWRNIKISPTYTTLGFADVDCRHIYINTLLADKRIPPYFLKFIVYHEMLHLVLGYEVNHNSRFKSLEMRFKKYNAAKKFNDDVKFWKIADDWIKWRKKK